MLFATSLSLQVQLVEESEGSTAASQRRAGRLADKVNLVDGDNLDLGGDPRSNDGCRGRNATVQVDQAVGQG